MKYQLEHGILSERFDLRGLGRGSMDLRGIFAVLAANAAFAGPISCAGTRLGRS